MYVCVVIVCFLGVFFIFVILFSRYEVQSCFGGLDGWWLRVVNDWLIMVLGVDRIFGVGWCWLMDFLVG